jgi:hypothetical protein
MQKSHRNVQDEEALVFLDISSRIFSLARRGMSGYRRPVEN